MYKSQKEQRIQNKKSFKCRCLATDFHDCYVSLFLKSAVTRYKCVFEIPVFESKQFASMHYRNHIRVERICRHVIIQSVHKHDRDRVRKIYKADMFWFQGGVFFSESWVLRSGPCACAREAKRVSNLENTCRYIYNWVK